MDKGRDLSSVRGSRTNINDKMVVTLTVSEGHTLIEMIRWLWP